MSKGKRYTKESKLNIKKVIAVIIAIAVIVMFVIGINTLLKTAKEPKNISVVTYYPVLTNQKWGVIDSLGNIVIEPTMDEMITIPENKTDLFICMYEVDYTNNTYKTKVINAKGKQLFSQYDAVEAIENQDKNNILWYESGVLKVRKDGKYGLIDTQGKEILPVEYDKIEALVGFANSLLITKEGKVGLCDNKGSIIIQPQQKEIKGIGEDYRNGYIFLTQEGTYGIMDFTKQILLEAKYQDIKPVTGNSLYVVKLNDTYQIIDKQGQAVETKSSFDDITEITKEVIIFTKNGKQGIMNANGEQIIKAQYESITSLFGDYYIAKKAGKYGIITKDQTILPFEYTRITYRKEADIIETEKQAEENTRILNNQFEEKLSGIVTELNVDKGYIRMRIGEEYKYYNFKFEEKISQEVLTNNTLFLSKKDGKYGYTDKEGNVVIDYIYEDGLEQNQYGYVAVKKDGKWGALDKNGKEVAPNQYDLENSIIIDFIGKWHLGEDINSNYYTDN